MAHRKVEIVKSDLEALKVALATEKEGHRKRKGFEPSKGEKDGS